MVQKIHDGREDVKIKELNKEQCVHCALYLSLSLYLDLRYIYIYIYNSTLFVQEVASASRRLLLGEPEVQSMISISRPQFPESHWVVHSLHHGSFHNTTVALYKTVNTGCTHLLS